MISGATGGKGGTALWKHLSNAEANEAVLTGQCRGLFTTDITAQIKELTDIAKVARAKKPLYHIHCDPSIPYTDQQFKDFFDSFEQEFGLQNQPYAEVTHIKHERAHRHRVYSLVRENGTCIQLSNDYARREKLARLAELANGEELTKGRHNRAVMHALRNEGNLSASHRMVDEGLTDGPPALAVETPKDRQIRERLAQERGFVESAVMTAWKQSDSPLAFSQALSDQGFTLAQGRKVAVMVDREGNVFPLARALGNASKQAGDRINTKDVTARLEGLELQPSDLVKSEIKKAIFVAGLKVKSDQKFEEFISTPIDDKSKKYQFDEEKILSQLREKIKTSPIKTKDFSKMSKEQAIAEQARIIAEMIMELIANLFGGTIRRNIQDDTESRIKQILEQRRSDWNNRSDYREGLERDCINEFKRQIGNITNSASGIPQSEKHREPFAIAGTIGAIGIEQDRSLDRASGSTDQKSDLDRKQGGRIIAPQIIDNFQLNQGLAKHEDKLKKLIKGLSTTSKIQNMCLKRLKDNDAEIWEIIRKKGNWNDKKGELAPPVDPSKLTDQQIKEICVLHKKQDIEDLRKDISKKASKMNQIKNQLTIFDKIRPSKSMKIKEINDIFQDIHLTKCLFLEKSKEVKSQNSNFWKRQIDDKRDYLSGEYQRFFDDISPQRKNWDENKILRKAIFNSDLEIINAIIDNDFKKAKSIIEERNQIKSKPIEILTKPKEVITIKPKTAYVETPTYEEEEYRGPRM